MDPNPSPPWPTPPEPTRPYPIDDLRIITGTIIILMVLFFLNAPDRDAILAGRPSSFWDLMTGVIVYTFPLALGFLLIVFAIHRLSEANIPLTPVVGIGGAGVILILSGAISVHLGWGRPPDLTAINTKDHQTILFSALSAYLTTYGWPLLICGVTAGVHSALELECKIAEIRRRHTPP